MVSHCDGKEEDGGRTLTDDRRWRKHVSARNRKKGIKEYGS